MPRHETRATHQPDEIPPVTFEVEDADPTADPVAAHAVELEPDPPGLLRTLWRRFKLLVRMLGDRGEPESELTWGKTLLIVLTLVYAVSPVDLIPDVLFPIGFADDFGAVALCLHLIHGAIVQYARRKGIPLRDYRIKRREPRT